MISIYWQSKENRNLRGEGEPLPPGQVEKAQKSIDFLNHKESAIEFWLAPSYLEFDRAKSQRLYPIKVGDETC